ncbi:MAG TPA: isocitrate lyase/phosphoenolpyruvate mutase family protein [Kribbellaceae bacterium]
MTVETTGTTGTGTTRTAAGFAALHRPGEPLLLPNAWDYATAAVLAHSGFPAVGTTSLGVAAAAGKPDAAGTTRAETLAVARTLTGLPVMVSVDLEGGYDEDPATVAGLVAEVAATGAVGVNLEDGRADGSLRPAALHAEVVAAVKERVPDLFVNARTDVWWLRGDDGTEAGRIDAALERAAAYAAAGADGVFVPAVATDDSVAALARGCVVPLNVLFLPGRHTVPRLAELGVARISLGSLLLRASLHSVAATAAAIRSGTSDPAPGAPSYTEISGLLPVANPR